MGSTPLFSLLNLEKYEGEVRSRAGKNLNIRDILHSLMVTETLRQELAHIREDLDYIKSVLDEDFELSTHAKKALKEARNTPESEYVEL